MDPETNYLVFCLIFLLIALFLSVYCFFVYSGLLASVHIRAQRPFFGRLNVVYKFSRGPYKNAGHLFTEAQSLIPDYKIIGIYYDDPQQVGSLITIFHFDHNKTRIGVKFNIYFCV